MVKKMLSVSDTMLTFFEEWLLCLSVLAALLTLTVNVFLRYCFNYSLAWPEELARQVIIIVAFIGASASVKNRSMIKIDALCQFFPGLKTPLIIFGDIITILFSIIVFYYGWSMAALQIVTKQKTIVMEIPLVYLFSILPLMAVMVFIRTIQVMYDEFHQTVKRPAS